MLQSSFIQALLLPIQVSWMWLISQSVKRCAAEKGRQILRIVTANSTVQQTRVFSANSSEAMTPRKGAGRKSMKEMAPEVVGRRKLTCGTLGLRQGKQVSGQCVGLNGGESDCVDDVIDLSATRQVIYRLAQALQHRAQAYTVGTALHRLVRRVAGVQVREHEYVRASGHRAVRGQLPGYLLVGGCIILQRPIDQ
ncbi:hypothetical protein ALQ64_102293 [Pseudomonas cannabina]|uniref:Uncharacterized protein n=1 Tax=Pseudomonas cannabina TaxID=86840 RepID=A0A0P9KNQ5_PSECA|nr:hypothetical protein ALO81_102082 [Pseudomonas cannabina]RMN16363.1 hypothetical protein ALQ64_102293 [Pseudomonas cannabina]